MLSYALFEGQTYKILHQGEIFKGTVASLGLVSTEVATPGITFFF